MGFPGGTSAKEHVCQCKRHKRCRFNTLVRKIPWKRAWERTPVFLPGESQGQRAWWPIAHRVTKSQTRLKRLSSSSSSFTIPWTAQQSSPPGSSVHGILQARILEWVAMPSSRGSSPFRDRTCVSCIASRFFPAEPLGKHYIHTI